MKLHNSLVNDPEWAAFLNSITGIDSQGRPRLVPRQSEYFRNVQVFGGVPSEFFRTLAGGVLQEIIARSGNDKKLVAKRAGMSVTNLYSILNGNTDPKLGTLLKIAHAVGLTLQVRVRKSPKS